MKKILFTLALTSAFGTVFAQNLLTNGSFETETDAGAFNLYTLSTTAAPDSWTFTPSAKKSDSYAGKAYALGVAKDGYWDIGMGAFGDSNNSSPADSSYDSLTQSLTTVAGANYTLSFYLQNPYGGFVFYASWNNAALVSTEVSNGPANWFKYTATVVGTGNSDTIGLHGYDGSSFGFLDDVMLVQAQAAPEPKSFMLAALAGIAGLAILRRRNG